MSDDPRSQPATVRPPRAGGSGLLRPGTVPEFRASNLPAGPRAPQRFGPGFGVAADYAAAFGPQRRLEQEVCYRVASELRMGRISLEQARMLTRFCSDGKPDLALRSLQSGTLERKQ